MESAWKAETEDEQKATRSQGGEIAGHGHLKVLKSLQVFRTEGFRL